MPDMRNNGDQSLFDCASTSLSKPEDWSSQEVDLDGLSELVKGLEHDGVCRVVCLEREFKQMREIFEEAAPEDSPAGRLGLNDIPVWVGMDALLRAVCDHLRLMLYNDADADASPIGLGYAGRLYIKTNRVRAVMVRRSGRITVVE